MDDLTSAADIIAAKGGPSVFADKIKRNPGVVRVWKHRNYFPREAWPEIITAFPDLPLEKLIRMEARHAWGIAPKTLPRTVGAAKSRGRQQA
jgi:hypothetical protein